jgi:hypothetical protein
MIEFIQSRTINQWMALSSWVIIILILFGIDFLKWYEGIFYIGLFFVAVYLGHVTTTTKKGRDTHPSP